MIVFCGPCSKTITATKRGANHYCSVCNTKFDEELDVEQSLKRVNKNKESTEPATQKRTEVTLTSIEVYELILFGWLQNLKKVGLSSKFRKCVRDLWANYRDRVLVKSENGKIEMVLTPNFAKRDLEIMIGKKYKRKKRKNFPSNKRLKKSFETNGDFEAIVNGDGRTDDDASGDEDEDENEEDLMQPTKYAKTSSAFIQGVMKLTKHKLLSFLCLGLILTREKFLISELSIAISNGTVPFQDISMFLPSNEARDIIFAYMLLHDFRYSHAKMIMTTRKLMNFIQIDCTKEAEGLSVSDIIERFAEIYHIPKKIVGYINKLIDLVPPVKEQLPGRTWIQSREIFCVAFVIFVLKLLFFLDDYHEYVLHNFTEKFDREFFSFVTWTKFLLFRKTFFRQYPKFKECNKADEKLCEYVFWQTNDNEDFNLDDFFSNHDVNFDDKVVFEAPEFKSFEDLSLNYILDPEKYEKEFEDVSLSKPYKRKVKHIRNVDNLSTGRKPLTEVVPKYMPFDDVKSKKGVRALVTNYVERNKTKKLNPAFNRNFHISKAKLKKAMSDGKRGRRKKSVKMENVTEPHFKTIFDSRNYWFKSLDIRKKRILYSSDEFNETKLPNFPKSFSFLLTEFARFSNCSPSYIYIYFEKIEMRFVDFEVKPEDNSCKANYLRQILHLKW